MNPLQDVFISYGRADSYHFAKRLNERLRAEGLEVWFDFDDIPLGVDYQKQIDDGIDKADNFLFIISPHSVNSPYCGLEIERALERGKRIIPLLQVEEISRETWQQRNPNGTDEQWDDYKAAGKHSSYPNMHPIIQKINWVYFRETDDFERSLSGLLTIFQHCPSYVRKHTVLLNQALSWQQNKRQRKYLLAGEPLQQAQDWLRVEFKDTQPPSQLTDFHCEYITESVKNAQNGKTQVFLAYEKPDTNTMLQIRCFLQRQGLTVWSGQTDISVGDDAQTAVNEGIENADNVITLLSPAFLTSEAGQHKLTYAASLNKRIIPIVVQAFDPTPLTESLRAILKSFQCIDLTTNHFSLMERSEESHLFKRIEESDLLKRIGDDSAYVATHKTLLVQSLKWEEQNQNPCVLLQGNALSQAEAWLKTAETRKSLKPIAQQRDFIQTSLNTPPIPVFDVFLSYSRENSDTAHKLNDALQQQGKYTWFDQENIPNGADFQEEIRQGIEGSDNFVFILSPASIESSYCKEEVEYATSLNKRCITILCREIDPSQLLPALANIQWIDFTQNDADFSANFNQLVRTLDTDRDHVQAHTKCSKRALEWAENGRSGDLLLRGAELAIAEEWQQQSIEEHKQPPLTALQTELIAASRHKVNAEAMRAKQRVAIMRQQLKATILASVFAIGGLGIFGVTGWLSFNWSKKDVRDIVRDWNTDISNYVQNSLRTDFEEIASFSDLVAARASNGSLDINNSDMLRDFIWQQSKFVDDQVNSIYVGTESGTMTGVSIGNGERRLNFVDDPSESIWRSYETTRDGQTVAMITETPKFYPRERPWYRQALASQNLDRTVSSLYKTVHNTVAELSTEDLQSSRAESDEAGSNEIVVSLSRVIYDQANILQGVASADLYLANISVLLSNAGGESTNIFIVESSGDLVASYPETQVIHNQDERIKAIASENSIIRNIALKLWPDSESDITCTMDELLNGQGQERVMLDGQPYFFQVSELKDEINLDWCMVTLIAEGKVMEEIQKSYRLTVAILISSLVMAMILGIYVYRTIRLSADFE
ncbi:MAG: TIR domain-containing protein [Leptolyngbyaceae cyanobacterium]